MNAVTRARLTRHSVGGDVTAATVPPLESGLAQGISRMMLIIFAMGAVLVYLWIHAGVLP